MKVLLSSVFGPFGVDDAYGRKENIMELFHNQVTREQGLFSLRFNHQSFGLYLMAENIRPQTTVLDFPTEQEFVQEICKGYDYVGISFIVPNFVKAKRMAELVRLHAPSSQIVLGGHGTRIPGLEDKLEYDHICRGEGVKWFRRLLGEDPDRPIAHPAIHSTFSKRILGIPLQTDAAVLIPGVGCPNGCRFCATSHFFDREYTPYLETGKALFDACVAAEEALGVREFFVMDENFLKRPQRAREFLELIEESQKPYRFGIFSSAETIADVGVEFLARLGVYFLWIGVESRREVYEKNRGLDLKQMIRQLRDHGISVLASGILFLEHHDRQTIWDDIDYLIDMESDLTQFMQLGPMPGTRLYQDYDAGGLLRHDIPFEEWHGQHRIWFDHPHFTGAESERLLRQAFRRDYDLQGSSLLRMCDTLIRGYQTLAGYRDPVMAQRRQELKAQASYYRQILPALARFAHNPRVRALTEEIADRFAAELGPMTFKQRAFARIAKLYAAREAVRVRTGRNRYQPRTIRTAFRSSLKDLVAGHLEGRNLSSLLKLRIDWSGCPVLVELAGTLDKVNSRALARKISSYLTKEGGDLVLSLDLLEAIEGRALKLLLSRIARYRGRVKVIFAEGAEAVREAITRLPHELASLVVEPTLVRELVPVSSRPVVPTRRGPGRP